MCTKVSELSALARWFHALSDETRLRVVGFLADGERCVCEIQAAVGATQSRLSFHLKVLRDAGLVRDRRAGRWVHYSLRPEVLEAMAAYVREHTPASPGWGSGDCGGPGARTCR